MTAPNTCEACGERLRDCECGFFIDHSWAFDDPELDEDEAPEDGE